MADYVREVDHYDVIVQNKDGKSFWRVEKEFFTEEEAVEYAKRAFDCGLTVTVREVNNVIWW